MTSPRKLLGLGNDGVGQRVGVSRLLAGPSALRAVQLGCGGFGFGFSAPHKGADVDFTMTVRAFHTPQNYPTVAYDQALSQSSPLPKLQTPNRMNALTSLKNVPRLRQVLLSAGQEDRLNARARKAGCRNWRDWLRSQAGTGGRRKRGLDGGTHRGCPGD